MEQKSLIAHAYDVLNESKEPLSFKELFAKVIERAGIELSEDQVKAKMASLYSQLTVDGRFASLQGGMWDLINRYKFDDVHTKIEEDFDEEGDSEDEDEEERKLLKAELGEEDEGNDDADEGDDIDFDKPKAEPEDEF